MLIIYSNRHFLNNCFFYSPYFSQCDHLCGPGKQTRAVTCYKKVDGKIEVLEDNACEGEVPEREKDCELRPCAGIDWITSEWSGVSPFKRLTFNIHTAERNILIRVFFFTNNFYVIIDLEFIYSVTVREKM